MSSRCSCWGGCGAEIGSTNKSTMLQHLESGDCSAGWNGHHISVLAIEYLYHGGNIWTYGRPRSPPQATQLLTKDVNGNSDCGTLDILMCPVCSSKFGTLGALFCHFEVSQCPSGTDEIAEFISRLSKSLQQNLAQPQIQELLDEAKYRLDSDRCNRLVSNNFLGCFHP